MNNVRNFFQIRRELIFLVFFLIFSFAIVYPFLLPFFVGVTLAFLVEPLFYRINSRFNSHNKKWKSYLISSLILLVISCIILAPIITFMIVGIQELYVWVSNLGPTLKSANYFHEIFIKVSALSHRFNYPMNAEELKVKFIQIINRQATEFLKLLGSFLGNLPRFFMYFFVVLLTWFFFLVDGKSYRERFSHVLFPWKTERQLIGNTIANLIHALILANGIIAVVQATSIFILLTAVGVPNNIPLALLSFFISFVPVIGTAPLTVGASLWCFFSQGRPTAALVLLIGACVIGIMDNVLRPLLMKGRADIEFFWIFIAILGGILTFGVAGVILGPLAFALFTASFQALEVASKHQD